MTVSPEIEKEAVLLALELQESIGSIRADIASIKRSLTSIEQTVAQTHAQTQTMIADLAAFNSALNAAENARGQLLH